MTVTYDPDADAVYIQLNGEQIDRTIELSDVCIVDRSGSGQLVGIELISCREFARESLELMVRHQCLTAQASADLLAALEKSMADA